MEIRNLLCMLGLAVMAMIPLSAIAMDASLLEISEQMDKVDRQDFQTAIDRGNDCTRARDFSCSESELAKAAKLANGGKDKNILAAAHQNIVGEKVRIAGEEHRRVEEERRLAQAEEERRLAEVEEERRLQTRREEEQREPVHNYNASIYAEIQNTIAETAATLNRVDRQTNVAYAETNRRLVAQAAERERARAEQMERAAEQRRETRRMEEARQSRERLAQADMLDRENQRRLEAERAAEQQQRELEAKRRDEERRSQELRDSIERKQVAEAEAVRKQAAAAAAKLAEQQARAQYLKSVAAGTRLVATKCPDGEGKFYATGIRPNIKPEVVACVDVHFRVYCPGSRQYSNGVADHFIGMSGCFGDAYEINPKPGCKVEEVRIDIVEARVCGG